jgi:hypothetical protein
MRRVGRILLGVLAVGCFVACLAMASLWWSQDERWSIVRRGDTDYALVIYRGRIGCVAQRDLPRPPEARTMAWVRNHPKVDWKREWAGFECGSAEFLLVNALAEDHPAFIKRYKQSSYVAAPSWVVVLLLAILPIAWSRRRFYAWRSRQREGCCPTCGYDLRATPDRCPECGTAAAAVGDSRG